MPGRVPGRESVAALSERLARLFPAAAGLHDELRTKIEQTLKKGLSELDIMTREEFDSQSQALQRAQQRLALLETRVTELEEKISQGDVEGDGKK